VKAPEFNGKKHSVDERLLRQCGADLPGYSGVPVWSYDKKLNEAGRGLGIRYDPALLRQLKLQTDPGVMGA
jgi:hypothetical protein